MVIHQKWRDLAVILSLVNLSFLSVWRELIFANRTDAYWMPDFTAMSYIAVLLNLACLVLLLWCLALLVRKSDRRALRLVARIGFLFALVLPLNYFRLLLDVDSYTIYWLIDNAMITVPAGLALAIGIVYLLFFRLSQVARLFALLLFILSPFALLTASQAAWQAVVQLNDHPPVVAVGQSGESAQTNGAIRQRVVWLLFDELDLRLTFTSRPDGVELPEFGRFRQQALFALNGESHSKNTEEAIPSFITGKLVANAIPSAPDVLKLELENDEPVKGWSEHPNVFAQAHALGFRSAIIGFYHPYCRVFAGVYSYCTWYAMNTFAPRATNSLFTEMASQIVGITPVFRRINGIKTYRSMLQMAPKMAANPLYDLVYVHVPVPHGPDIYNLRSGGLTLFNVSKTGYFGNLILADRLLGELRRSMEAAELWKQSAVLITADHEWRHVRLYDNQRVRKLPYLLKMPGQDRTVVYEPSFSPMRVTKDIVLSILTGNLLDTNAVVEWLNAKKADKSR